MAEFSNANSECDELFVFYHHRRNGQSLLEFTRMNTLTSPSLAALLTRLFCDAEASDAQLKKDMSDQSPKEIARRAGSNDYLEFYRRAKNYHLAVSPETGRLLYMLARISGARHIVEFGTSFGISTLHLAAALKDNGGGQLIGSEFESSKVARARANIGAAGFSEFVEIREGDALETLARDLPPSIDFVLLDGAKSLYSKVLTLLEPRLRPGALIVADNADWCPEYLSRIRANDSGFLSVPFGGEVELSMLSG
jgi:predicted O-methyltransferase YrrM